jgi:hypothetical protein
VSTERANQLKSAVLTWFDVNCESCVSFDSKLNQSVISFPNIRMLGMGRVLTTWPAAVGHQQSDREPKNQLIEWQVCFTNQTVKNL